jgi:hypothetical protein
MVTAPRSRRVPKGEAGNACAGPLGAAIQPSLRPQPVLLSGPPCVKGRATHPLAFLRSLEKSSQRPLPLIFSAGYVDQFSLKVSHVVAPFLLFTFLGFSAPLETHSQSFTLITNFSNSDSSSNNHPSKVQSPHCNRVRENPDIGRSRHAQTAPRTTPMFVPQVAVLN